MTECYHPDVVTHEATPNESGPTDPHPTTPGEPDDALILWMLSLTPTQRLEVAQGFIDSVQALRDGARALQQKQAAEPDR